MTKTATQKKRAKELEDQRRGLKRRLDESIRRDSNRQTTAAEQSTGLTCSVETSVLDAVRATPYFLIHLF
jgi:hypothetical protein